MARECRVRVKMVVIGATGRLGRMFQAIWQGREDVIWQGRGDVPAGWMGWDILSEPCPPGFIAPGTTVLVLAGVTRGDAAQLAQNTALALAVCKAAAEAGAAQVLIASSIAVYGVAADGAPPFREEDGAAPQNGYGRAKAEMERAVLDWQAAAGAEAPGVTLLRIGNVIGADALIGGAVSDVVLDPVPGQAGGPQRAAIGALSLARVLEGLAHRVAEGQPLPQVLNIAAPGAVSMAALLDAAGIRWCYGPENPQVLPRAAMDTALLETLLPGAAGAGDAEQMIAEWRRVTEMMA